MYQRVKCHSIRANPLLRYFISQYITKTKTSYTKFKICQPNTWTSVSQIQGDPFANVKMSL